MAERIYDPRQVEARWQRWWEEQGTNKVDLRAAQNPYYVLMMFPYPSAEGLHVGNVYAFTGADIQGRYRRLRGHDVFEPIGFDAFGIHSENFAMKVNRHPRELIPANVANFTRQLKMMGLMFDWDHQVDTTSPGYYKWTQWVFLQLLKAGFVYRDTKEVNFCPACGTVISDEQKNPDGTCERHGDVMVERRNMPCWFFKITEFAGRLAANHEWLDWSETTKTAQVNWIGRSKGAEVHFAVDGHEEKITVFTTRPDTLFGATFMVLSPEHPLVGKITSEEKKKEVEEYRKWAAEQANAPAEEAQPKKGGTGILPVSGDARPQEEAPELRARQGAYLPHWTKPGAIYSVCFRLHDALPREVRESYVAERDDIIKTAKQLGRPLSDDEQDRLEYLFSEKVEAALDNGAGSCLLSDDRAAKVVADALRHFDGDRYRLHAWCVMPNHVHVIVEPLEGWGLEKLLHSWKSFTANEINKLLGRAGEPVWQAEYFDHIIRNEASYERQLDYVASNPANAGLRGWGWVWRTSAPGHGQDARATLFGAASTGKDKTGVFTGAHAINPANGEKLPIYIADYVLMGYGTGAIMAVPSGDHRDFAFARKFGLPVPCIIDPDLSSYEDGMLSGIEGMLGKIETAESREKAREAVLAGEAAWSGPGKMINSGNSEICLDGLPKEEAVAAMCAWLEKKGLGHAKDQFRLRDWGISRQRYWGPPVPVLYDEEGNIHPVPEEMLPVTLPDMDDFRPKGDGRGPLANAHDWVNVEIDGKKYRRETDVMDNFLDSAWYFLRYPSARDSERAYDPELMKKWLPVDIYVGGNEHAVLHLLYTRFICMALCEAGVLEMGTTSGKAPLKDPAEPFRKFRAHGLLVKEGAKMSKSKGNVVNPDAFVEEHGADTLRGYLMFLGPYTQGGDFRDKDIMGIRRFFNRVFDYYLGDAPPAVVAAEELPKEVLVKIHQTIKKVGEDLEALSYNTAIAALMELLNALRGCDKTCELARESLCIMLAPFAPHLAEEIWHEALGHSTTVCSAAWPSHDPALTVLDEVEVAIQVNGKVRDKAVVARTIGKEELEKVGRESAAVQKALAEGGAIRKVVAVPGRLVNVIIS